MIVKFGALLFILLLPATDIINFQLLGGVWIIQTLPPVFIGLYTNWMHRWAMIIGWAAGMITGTWMAIANNFASSVFTISLGNVKIAAYIAVYSVVVNLVLSVVLTPIFRAAGVPSGNDETQAIDYEEEGLAALPKEPLMEELA